MFIHNKFNEDLSNECLSLIEKYKVKKSNSISDDFYKSHLDCFTSLIEDWKDDCKNCFAIIINEKGHMQDNGTYSPVYATICKSPHWCTEGVLLSGNLYDATKFDLNSQDLYPILGYLKERFPSRKFNVIKVNKSIFGSNPKELWSDKYTRGDFDKSGRINGNFVKEVQY